MRQGLPRITQIGARFSASRFRERFESKGRFRGYLSAIPTFVITAEEPAFLGWLRFSMVSHREEIRYAATAPFGGHGWAF